MQRELNFLSNVEATLEQRCSFHVVASKSLQHSLNDVATLPQRCHDVVCLLGRTNRSAVERFTGEATK